MSPSDSAATSSDELIGSWSPSLRAANRSPTSLAAPDEDSRWAGDGEGPSRGPSALAGDAAASDPDDVNEIALPPGVGGQPCPNCGDGHLQRVRNREVDNLLCPTCGTCWHRRGRRIERVDIFTCPGCRSRRVCIAALAERSP
jgi:hypothetical protein